MIRLLSDYASALLDILLPPRCHICRCHLPDHGKLLLCESCIQQLPVLSEPYCTVCGIPFDGKGENHPCSRCLVSPPPYQAARAAFSYSSSCRDIVHRFKYHKKSYLRKPLGLLLAKELAGFAADCRADLLLPVPLHKSRLRKRGFNQSVLLAEILSKQWGIPLMRQVLKRIRPTVPQMELGREQRLTNLKGAFEVADTQAVTGLGVILVDDVFTTGSTIAECSDVLLQAGCSRVFAVTVAHAP